MEKTDEARFSKKKPVHSIIRKMWSKMWFFTIFSKTALRISIIYSQNVEENGTDHLQKTVCEKLIWILRYLMSKFPY